MQNNRRKTSNENKSGIHKNVRILGWVSFFTDASSEMLYPIIPFFLTVTLGAPAKALGIMEGIAEAVSALTKGFSGSLSDRIRKRKVVIFSGYSLSSLAKFAMAMSNVWALAALSRFLERMGKGLRTPARDALIADVTEEDFRGQAFGFHRAMDTWGAVLGAGFAFLFLLIFKENFRSVILVSLIPACIAVFLIIRIEEKKRPYEGSAGRSTKLILSPPQDPLYRKFLLVYTFFSLGASSATFVILRARSIGFSYAGALLPYILANAVYAASSEKAGKLSDMLGRRNVLLVGMLMFTLSYAVMFFAESRSSFILALLLFGFYMAATEGVGKAFITDLVDENEYGRGLGFFYLVTGITTLVSSTTAGILWDEVSKRAPFFQGMLLGLISSTLLFALIPSRRR